MNFLGLDYGIKKIGVALATGPLAEPLATFATSRSMAQIQDLAKAHHIDLIVIGQPDKSLGLEFNKFINSLKVNNLKLKIVDETLSSHDARQSLSHTSPKRRKAEEHAVSATLILQNFLDSQIRA
jgi:putative transcription antitermination factor YqgF